MTCKPEPDCIANARVSKVKKSAENLYPAPSVELQLPPLKTAKPLHWSLVTYLSPGSEAGSNKTSFVGPNPLFALLKERRVRSDLRRLKNRLPCFQYLNLQNKRSACHYPPDTHTQSKVDK